MAGENWQANFESWAVSWVRWIMKRRPSITMGVIRAAVSSGPLTASLARPGRLGACRAVSPGTSALLQGARGECGAGVCDFGEHKGSGASSLKRTKLRMPRNTSRVPEPPHPGLRLTGPPISRSLGSPTDADVAGAHSVQAAE
jgi:hypothetical protein